MFMHNKKLQYTVRVAEGNPELWNPVTGERRALPAGDLAGGKDGEQSEEGDAASVEHDVTPPTAGEGANRQLAPEQGQGCQSGLWIQARGLGSRQTDRLTPFGVRRYPLRTSLNL